MTARSERILSLVAAEVRQEDGFNDRRDVNTERLLARLAGVIDGCPKSQDRTPSRLLVPDWAPFDWVR